MAYNAKKDSRHITLRPEAMAIYDRWKDEGSAIANTSQAIVEYDKKGDIIEQMRIRLEQLEKEVKTLKERIEGKA